MISSLNGITSIMTEERVFLLFSPDAEEIIIISDRIMRVWKFVVKIVSKRTAIPNNMLHRHDNFSMLLCLAELVSKCCINHVWMTYLRSKSNISCINSNFYMKTLIFSMFE